MRIAALLNIAKIAFLAPVVFIEGENISAEDIKPSDSPKTTSIKEKLSPDKKKELEGKLKLVEADLDSLFWTLDGPINTVDYNSGRKRLELYMKNVKSRLEEYKQLKKELGEDTNFKTLGNFSKPKSICGFYHSNL
jgi:hypothetical protein